MGSSQKSIDLPLFGDRRYILNKAKARKEGYRIFRAVHSCGCCHIEMAFRNVHNIRVQFDMPKFADTVRDDMGVIHECVNTKRGFKEVVLRLKTDAVTGSRATQNIPVQPKESDTQIDILSNELRPMLVHEAQLMGYFMK